MSEFFLDLPMRPRRNRKSPGVRAMVQETHLTPAQLVLPVFVHEDPEDQPLASMPGCTRWSLDGLLREAEGALEDGIRALVLFPKVPEGRKTPGGEEAFDPEGLVPRALRALKQRLPELVLVTDVALDPYSSDGHDGLVVDGEVVNDATVDVLAKQAVMQAEAGADIIAPSDMMDGRIGALREALDLNGHTGVSLLSYTAKYASAFYGPFRGALDSAPKAGDKKTYQMDPANAREALRELALDEHEGADMVMVKPAGPYLDVIARMREATTLPIAAYQVSGEYLALRSACDAGWLQEREAVLESLIGIRRAGADLVLTYFARSAARWLREG
ncbi:MAG: porphobilinogen synthase [Planctomycetota bacterium]|nr:porphobilinogen synthase [Planctomycetota bacterium]